LVQFKKYCSYFNIISTAGAQQWYVTVCKSATVVVEKKIIIGAGDGKDERSLPRNIYFTAVAEFLPLYIHSKFTANHCCQC
jgi:hypothetical protein